MTWTFLNFLVNRVTATCDGVQGMEGNTLSNLFFLGEYSESLYNFFILTAQSKMLLSSPFSAAIFKH